jgi:hypothetical protein
LFGHYGNYACRFCHRAQYLSQKQKTASRKRLAVRRRAGPCDSGPEFCSRTPNRVCRGPSSTVPGTQPYRFSALGSPHAAKRFIGLAIVVRTRSRAALRLASQIDHHEHRAFHGLFRAWPAAAAAAACDHAAPGLELTCGSDYCIETPAIGWLFVLGPHKPRLHLYGRQPRRMGCNLWFCPKQSTSIA